MDWSTVDTSEALIYAESALGIGAMHDLADIIYVKPETFDTLSTERIAQELLEFNRRMREEGRSYILVGPGAGARRTPSSASRSSGPTSPRRRSSSSAASNASRSSPRRAPTSSRTSPRWGWAI